MTFVMKESGFLKRIIWGNHKVNYYSCDSYIEPDRKTPPYNFFMLSNFHIQTEIESDQNKG